MSAFNSTEEISGVSSQWNSLNSLVTQTYAGDVLDFSSSSDVTILNTLAEPSNYGGCTANNFQSDSWIPSINVGTIACTSSAGNDATST